MATAKLRVVRDDSDSGLRTFPPQETSALNRIREVRERQGASLRTCARKMRVDMRSLRAQEDPTADLSVSQLRMWQTALEVPLAELIEETDVPLSRPVMERARLVRVMKTAMSIAEQADSPALQRFAQVLLEQLVEIMPELEEVSSWHSVGQRRTLDELGRIAERPVSTQQLGNQLLALSDD